MRAHLARLAPGARVRIHRDRGGYVQRRPPHPRAAAGGHTLVARVSRFYKGGEGGGGGGVRLPRKEPSVG